MQSIAINTQYGDFSLSPLVVKRLTELQNKQCYFFTHESGNCHKHIPITLKQAAKEFMWFAYTVPNPDEVAGSQENWHEMTFEQKQASNKKWDDISISNRPEKRDDPNLIKVIRELKKESKRKICYFENCEDS